MLDGDGEVGIEGSATSELEATIHHADGDVDCLATVAGDGTAFGGRAVTTGSGC